MFGVEMNSNAVAQARPTSTSISSVKNGHSQKKYYLVDVENDLVNLNRREPFNFIKGAASTFIEDLRTSTSYVLRKSNPVIQKINFCRNDCSEESVNSGSEFVDAVQDEEISDSSLLEAKKKLSSEIEKGKADNFLLTSTPKVADFLTELVEDNNWWCDETYVDDDIATINLIASEHSYCRSLQRKDDISPNGNIVATSTDVDSRSEYHGYIGENERVPTREITFNNQKNMPPIAEILSRTRMYPYYPDDSHETNVPKSESSYFYIIKIVDSNKSNSLTLCASKVECTHTKNGIMYGNNVAEKSINLEQSLDGSIMTNEESLERNELIINEHSYCYSTKKKHDS